MSKRDKRDCPKCGTRMEYKAQLDDAEEMPSELWQCPACKNVEVT